MKEQSKEQPKEQTKEQSSEEGETVQIVVARGPFTSRDDGDFEQLRELLRLCKESRPSLLVLVRTGGGVEL